MQINQPKVQSLHQAHVGQDYLPAWIITPEPPATRLDQTDTAESAEMTQASFPKWVYDSFLLKPQSGPWPVVSSGCFCLLTYPGVSLRGPAWPGRPPLGNCRQGPLSSMAAACWSVGLNRPKEIKSGVDFKAEGMTGGREEKGGKNKGTRKREEGED